jgi:hypothetical protein
MSSRIRNIVLAIGLTALAGCGSKDSSASEKAPVEQPAKPPIELPDWASPEAAPGDTGLSGRHREQTTWVPAEYRSGKGRWRDAGVYVDGKPIGMIWFGELPVSLKPVWKDDVQMLDFNPGDQGPREKPVKVRRYRIAEYLEALGVDLAKVKELHIQGGKGVPAVVTGKELRRMRDGLHFSFGRTTSGKPLLHLPEGIKTNTSFDHVVGLMVYIDKKPPIVDGEDDLILDGKLVTDVPYFGEPMRGGVRVYKDDRLVAVIKRRKLEGIEGITVKGADGTVEWKLFAFLEAEGVKTDDIVQAEIVYDERRGVRLDRDALVDARFKAAPQQSGTVLLGKDGVPSQVITLFSNPLGPPQVIEDEDI